MLLNAFSLNMIQAFPASVTCTEISAANARSLLMLWAERESPSLSGQRSVMLTPLRFSGLFSACRCRAVVKRSRCRLEIPWSSASIQGRDSRKEQQNSRKEPL